MTSRNVHPLIARRKAIVTRWRALKLPRLYWKTSHRLWKWDSGEIARSKDHRFNSIEAIELFLDAIEGKKQPDTPQPIRKGRT